MISRPHLLKLVLSFIILVVAFAVLMAFQVLIGALGDESGAKALLWVALSFLILAVIDLLVLVVVVGLRVAGEQGDDEGQ